MDKDTLQLEYYSVIRLKVEALLGSGQGLDEDLHGKKLPDA